MWTRVVALLLVTLYCSFLPLVYSSAAPLNYTVQTVNGWVNGMSDGRGHKIWYGLPYARPPVGSLRWKLPRPPLNWSGVKQTQTFGLPCPQPGVSYPTSEDCLFLNVNTPSSWSPSLPLLPVMIWIHGGSFWGGSGNLNPSTLESNEMVFVSINYRLGVFGFLNLPEMINGTDGTAGFFGIQDQRMAFQWVKANIRNFGGDPARVTISGQSAGAISVCTHLAAPRSNSLFQQALMESGSCNQLNTEASATSSSFAVASRAGCPGTSVLSCLNSKNTSTLVAAFTGPIWPSFNKYEINSQPITLIKQGKYNKVALLAGSNHDEQSFQTCVNYRNTNVTNYNSTMRSIFWNDYASKMYPVQFFSPPVDGLTAAWSDSRFRYPTLDLASAMSQHQTMPVYLYSFNHIPSSQTDPCYKVQHSAELGFVFGVGTTAGEKLMASSMREWWSSFVSSGVPRSNTSSTITWAPYVDSQKNYMSLNATLNVSTCAMRSNFLGAYYTFWLSPSNYTGPVPNPNLPPYQGQ